MSRSGLKTGVENYIFWPETGSGFGEPGGTPPQRIASGTLRVEVLYKQYFVDRAFKFILALLRTEKLSVRVGFSTPCCFKCLQIDEIEGVFSLMR